VEVSKLFSLVFVFLIDKREKPPERIGVETPERRDRSMVCLFFGVSGMCLASFMGLSLAPGSELDGKPATGGPVTHSVKPVNPVKPIPPEKTESGCGSHGTRVEFVDTPREAAKVAKKEQKLVFVLHVSGNFEDPRFT
jgi:hypothetical protein